MYAIGSIVLPATMHPMTLLPCRTQDPESPGTMIQISTLDMIQLDRAYQDFDSGRSESRRIDGLEWPDLL